MFIGLTQVPENREQFEFYDKRWRWRLAAGPQCTGGVLGVRWGECPLRFSSEWGSGRRRQHCLPGGKRRVLALNSFAFLWFKSGTFFFFIYIIIILSCWQFFWGLLYLKAQKKIETILWQIFWKCSYDVYLWTDPEMEQLETMNNNVLIRQKHRDIKIQILDRHRPEASSPVSLSPLCSVPSHPQGGDGLGQPAA